MLCWLHHFLWTVYCAIQEWKKQENICSQNEVLLVDAGRFLECLQSIAGFVQSTQEHVSNMLSSWRSSWSQHQKFKNWQTARFWNGRPNIRLWTVKFRDLFSHALMLHLHRVKEGIRPPIFQWLNSFAVYIHRKDAFSPSICFKQKQSQFQANKRKDWTEICSRIQHKCSIFCRLWSRIIELLCLMTDTH